MTIPWYAWLFVTLAPLACAAAGALTHWAYQRRTIERRLDACWDEAWDACLDSVAAQWQGHAVDAMATVTARATEGQGGAVAAAETLPALPAVHHEGGRHGRPHSVPWRHDDLQALSRVRDEFARIRMGLGLWP